MYANPAEAPIVANDPIEHTWYEVEYAYSFYGSEKSRVYPCRTEGEALQKVRELARQVGDRWRQYVFFRRMTATALPLPKE